MTKKLIAVIFICLFSNNIFAQNDIVAKVGSYNITKDEYNKQYLKSISDYSILSTLTQKERREFLDLYINYKLKVIDARERGINNNPDLSREIDEFRKNYLVSFYIDKKLVDPYISNLIEKQKTEVRVSQIYIRLTTPCTEADSIAAYQRAYSLIDSLNNGLNITYLSVKYSDDPYAYTNGGDLYYFTAGMTGLPDFDEYIYGMNAGEYSKSPFRTIFGLHILMLTDKKPKPNDIKLSHILIRDIQNEDGKVTDSTSSLTKINGLLDSLKDGKSFEYLAQKYSEDQGSAIQNGNIGYIQRRKIGPPWAIDSTAFTLPVDKIAGPLRSGMGWHIIKVTDIKQSENEVDAQEKKNEYKRGFAFKNDYKKFTSEIRKKYDYKIYDEGINILLNSFDTTKPVIKQKLDSIFSDDKRETKLAEFRKSLNSYGTESFLINDFIKFIVNARDFNTLQPTKSNLLLMLEEASSNPILFNAATAENLDNDSEFSSTFNEFVDGLLIFKVQEELTGKAMNSDAEIKAYYEQHKSEFTYKDSTGVHQKSFTDSKIEISNILQPNKLKITEEEYITALKKTFRWDWLKNYYNSKYN